MKPRPETPAQREARRAEVRKLLDKLEATRPAWSRMPPWQAEKLLEYGADKRQRDLFTNKGDDDGTV